MKVLKEIVLEQIGQNQSDYVYFVFLTSQNSNYHYNGWSYALHGFGFVPLA